MPLPMYPGVPSSISGSTSLSDETLSCDPVSCDILNTEPLTVSFG